MVQVSAGQPKLSVIIPAYNQMQSLPRCIESVQAQTLGLIEIIIVDDCSSDGTKDVVEGLANDDSRIVYLRTKVNSGPSVARDLGCRSASSAFITTLDADDIYLSPEKLAHELELAETRATSTRPAIGYSRYVLLDQDLAPLPSALQPKEPLLEGDLLAAMISRSSCIPRDFVFPKSLYFEVGGYDPEIPIYEDWDLKLRLARHADFYRTEVEGTGYVQHADGLSKALPAEHEAWLSAVFRKNIGLLDTDRQAEAKERFAGFLGKREWTGKLAPAPALTERQRLGEGLVFLLSMPRAGSTLVQRMMASHSAIHSRSESWLMLQPLLARQTDASWAPYNQELAASALDDFVAHLPGGDADYHYWLRTCFAGLYREAMGPGQTGYYLDKTPRYHLIWEDLMVLFPRAKFILLWRHPLAVLHSMYETMDYDDQLMDFWQVDLQQGLDNLAALRETGRAFEVSYEDLIANPDRELRRITDYLGIAFEAAMLDLTRSQDDSGWRLGDQKQALKASGLQNSSLDRWKHVVKDRAGFAALADGYLRANKDVLKTLDYDFDAMRAEVPSVNGKRADLLFRKSSKLQRRQTLRSKADIALADRWQKRLTRLGPLPYVLGRFAWRTFSNFKK